MIALLAVAIAAVIALFVWLGLHIGLDPEPDPFWPPLHDDDAVLWPQLAGWQTDTIQPPYCGRHASTEPIAA